MAKKRKIVHWLNKKKRYTYKTNYRAVHYSGAPYWSVDCSVQGWAFLEVTTDKAKVTCKKCKHIIKAEGLKCQKVNIL